MLNICERLATGVVAVLSSSSVSASESAGSVNAGFGLVGPEFSRPKFAPNITLWVLFIGFFFVKEGLV